MPLAPLAATDRFRGVDIARGVALLGVLFVNTRTMFAPYAFSTDPSVALDGSERTAADATLWACIETVCTLKFNSLFSMLFGFGLAMLAARAREVGHSPWPSGLRRLAMLAAVGVLHWMFLWYGDILMVYAPIGVVAIACTAFSRRAVGRIVAAMAVGVALLALVGALNFGDGSGFHPVGPALEQQSAAELSARGTAAIDAAQHDPSSAIWIAAERAAFAEGPFRDALAFRWANYSLGFVAELRDAGWQMLFMMVFGVYAFKAGLFAPEGSAFRRRAALPALVVGLALASMGAWPAFLLGFDSLGAARAHAAFIPVGAMVLPFAYAAILVEWGPRLPAFVATPLERTGRMAMTVYLSESLVCTALAGWWGLGWFGTLGDAHAAITAVSVWLGLALFATAWLAVFPIGPLEWLLRAATYAGNPAELNPSPGVSQGARP